MWKGLALLVCCFVSAVFQGQAQEFRATVTGHVTDASSAAVPRVTVLVRNLSTNETATAVTDNGGSYTVPFLRPGVYQVVVEAPGFKKFIRDNVTLNVGQSAGIDIPLEVGALTESVTVTAETPILETEKADRGLVINEISVKELPLNARNPFMLSILSAGVNFNGNVIYQRPFDNGAIAEWNVNGGLERNNEFLLDGAPNNAQAGGNNIAYVPPVDSVQEFKVQTNSYDAQYGKTGGGVVNVSLKSGTNQIHGTLYEFGRRNFLDANSFQNNARGTPRVEHFLDQYGGAIGGPIIIPKLYNGKDKSFFFFNYEGYREGTPTPLTLSVPQPEFLQGDFSKLVDSNGNKITIYDPATGRTDASGAFVRDAFPNNIIPQNRLNPIALKILGFSPKPNTTTPGSAYSVNNLFIPGGDNLDRDDFYNLVIKFDQNFGSNHHVFFRHASNDRTEIRSFNGILGKPGEDAQDPLKRVNDAYVIDWVGTLAPTLIANMRVSFNRYIEGSRGDGNQGFDLTSLGFPASLVNQLPTPGFFGRYEFSSYTSIGRYYSFNYTNTWAAHPTVTKIFGPHTIKAGLDLRWINYNVQNVGNGFRLTADRGFTQRIYNNGDALSGNSIASFLLGTPSGGNIDYNAFPKFNYRYLAPYIQDDWKVSRKLTLNFGIRWDFNIAASEARNRLNRGFDPTAVNPANSQVDRSLIPGNPTLRGALLFAGQGNIPQIASNTDLTAFQPRIGFAYQVTPKLVARGGFGKYYLNPNNDYLQTSGFSVTTNIVNSLDGGRTPVPGLINSPFPSVAVPPGSSLGAATFLGRGFDFVDPTFKLPYVNQFSFGFQYQLPFQSRLEISYVGNRTYKIETNRPYNEPGLAFRKQCNPLEGGSPAYCDALLPNPFYQNPAFATTGLTALYTDPTISRFQLNRPFPEYGGLTQRARNDGKLWYNSLQTTYEIRGHNGLNMSVAYTYSKSVYQEGFNDVQAFVPQRSIYQHDRPHVVKIGAVYQLPVGPGKKFGASAGPVMSRLIGGWETNAIYTYSSGRPWQLPGNVLYVKEASQPTIDWTASKIYGLRPCVGKINDDGSITQQQYSKDYGCAAGDYNFLILPRYAPRVTPFYDGRLRLHAVPQLDFSLNKNTRIKEKMSLQFRAEAFNVTNTFYFPFEQFNNDPNNSNFGTIIKSTVSQGNANFPRQIQLALKFIF